MSERVTIKSIARDLGISHMTVSRALSGNPNVNKETRQTILKRAGELGYVRSAAARAMRGAGTGIVGLLLPNIINEFYARFANALAHDCDRIGMHLIIHLTDDDPGLENEAIRRLQQVQAETVVMVPAPPDEQTDPVPTGTMNVVQLIRTRPSDTSSRTVLLDDYSAISGGVAHLAERGHARIAYIGADVSLSSGRSRLDAFLNGLSRAGFEPDKRLIRTVAPSHDAGEAAARTLLRDQKPEAILCGGFEISNGALHALLTEAGQDLSGIAFIGYGDSPFYRWIGGGITTVGIPVERMAAETARLLGAGEPAGSQITLAAELILRESTMS